MESFTTRQIVTLIAALLISGGLTAWGTVYVLRTSFWQIRTTR